MKTALPSEEIHNEFARLLPHLNTANWTASDHANYFAMFAHGWYGRANEAAYQHPTDPMATPMAQPNRYAEFREQFVRDVEGR